MLLASLGIIAVLAALGIGRGDPGTGTEATEPASAPVAAASHGEDAPESGPWAIDPSIEGADRRRLLRARGKAKAKARAKAKAERRAELKAFRERERVLDADEMMWARSEYREKRLVDMNDRLDRFAANAGWDAALTDDVRQVMLDTIDEITEQLLRVDAGEIEWAEMRREMRAFRVDQAAEVEELLGPESFHDFAEAMGFARFAGEEQVRGRVRMRRGQRAAKR